MFFLVAHVVMATVTSTPAPSILQVVVVVVVVVVVEEEGERKEERWFVWLVMVVSFFDFLGENKEDGLG